MTARNASRFAAALLVVACGPALTPAEQREQDAQARFFAAMVKDGDEAQSKLLKDLQRYCREQQRPATAAQHTPPYVFMGTMRDSQSPYDGSKQRVYDRGVLAQKHRGKTRVYDGQFLYFHAPPDKPFGVAIAFIGHTQTVDEPQTRRFALLVSEGFGGAVVMMDTDQDYLDSLEKKYGDQVATYKAKVAEEAEQSKAMWSLGEALVVGMGSELLKTGDATKDELIETGLKYGVAVARDGLDAATKQLLAEQKARLIRALDNAVEASTSPSVIAARGGAAVPGLDATDLGAPSGSDGALGSCNASATGICTEVRAGGDAAAFREHCSAQSGNTYSPAACSGSWVFTCKGAEGTSGGKRNPIDLYFPSGFCEAHPGTDTKRTCEKLGGRSSGTPCNPPK